MSLSIHYMDMEFSLPLLMGEGWGEGEKKLNSYLKDFSRALRKE